MLRSRLKGGCGQDWPPYDLVQLFAGQYTSQGRLPIGAKPARRYPNSTGMTTASPKGWLIMGFQEAPLASDTIRGDRRLQRRYPIELELEYRILKGDKVVSTGFGTTGNMSSGGILFRPAGEAPLGATVELAVRWPATLGNSPFLDLRIYGRMIRNDANGIAVEMSHYDFQKLDDARAAYDQLFTYATIQ